MSDKIRIKYWGKQRMGNYQIRVERLKDLDIFKAEYINGVLKEINTKITQANKLDEKENRRRWYIEPCHFDYLRNDVTIELFESFVFNNNK